MSRTPFPSSPSLPQYYSQNSVLDFNSPRPLSPAASPTHSDDEEVEMFDLSDEVLGSDDSFATFHNNNLLCVEKRDFFAMAHKVLNDTFSDASLKTCSQNTIRTKLWNPKAHKGLGANTSSVRTKLETADLAKYFPRHHSLFRKLKFSDMPTRNAWFNAKVEQGDVLCYLLPMGYVAIVVRVFLDQTGDISPQAAMNKARFIAREPANVIDPLFTCAATAQTSPNTKRYDQCLKYGGSFVSPYTSKSVRYFVLHPRFLFPSNESILAFPEENETFEVTPIAPDYPTYSFAPSPLQVKQPAVDPVSITPSLIQLAERQNKDIVIHVHCGGRNVEQSPIQPPRPSTLYTHITPNEKKTGLPEKIISVSNPRQSPPLPPPVTWVNQQQQQQTQQRSQNDSSHFYIQRRKDTVAVRGGPNVNPPGGLPQPKENRSSEFRPSTENSVRNNDVNTPSRSRRRTDFDLEKSDSSLDRSNPVFDGTRKSSPFILIRDTELLSGVKGEFSYALNLTWTSRAKNGGQINEDDSEMMVRRISKRCKRLFSETTFSRLFGSDSDSESDFEDDDANLAVRPSKKIRNTLQLPPVPETSRDNASAARRENLPLCATFSTSLNLPPQQRSPHVHKNVNQTPLATEPWRGGASGVVTAIPL